MSREGIVERAEAPELRRPSPIWKWLFLGTLILGGFGVLGALLFGDLERGGVVSEEKEDEKSRLNFKSDGFSLPTFAKPEPEAPPTTVAQEPPPAVPTVPELPQPETIHDKPVAQALPAPVQVVDAPKEESPEEIARKRRLKGALSGSVDAGPAAPDEEAAAARQAASTMDLTVTKTKASVATRYQDLTFTVPKGSQIGCILNTAIQSGQTGMISCTVPQDIYGADGTVVLLDRGSQAMGEYKTATLTYGKRRIYVVWSSIRTPEGVVIDIDSPGTGPLGEAGVGGHINNHYWERVGHSDADVRRQLRHPKLAARRADPRQLALHREHPARHPRPGAQRDGQDQAHPAQKPGRARQHLRRPRPGSVLRLQTGYELCQVTTAIPASRASIPTSRISLAHCCRSWRAMMSPTCASTAPACCSSRARRAGNRCRRRT